MTDQTTISGGCYCGGVRYESTGPPVSGGMCHCRSCQRWTGSAAAMGIFFSLNSFQYTQGKPKTFMTSEILERSFCADCGTSIGHRYVVPPFNDMMIVFIGTLDHPEEYDGPQHHFGIESHLDNWLILGEGVPTRKADGDPQLAEAWASVGETPGR